MVRKHRKIFHGPAKQSIDVPVSKIINHTSGRVSFYRSDGHLVTLLSASCGALPQYQADNYCIVVAVDGDVPIGAISKFFKDSLTEYQDRPDLLYARYIGDSREQEKIFKLFKLAGDKEFIVNAI